MSIYVACAFCKNKNERPVDALAVKIRKNINYSLTDPLTTSNQEMLAHLKISLVLDGNRPNMGYKHRAQH